MAALAVFANRAKEMKTLSESDSLKGRQGRHSATLCQSGTLDARENSHGDARAAYNLYLVRSHDRKSRSSRELGAAGEALCARCLGLSVS
jgi:hypothetical protein